MKLENFFKYSIVLILFPALYTGFFPGKIVVVRTVCYVLFSVLFLNIFKYLPKRDFDTGRMFRCFMWFNIIMYVRGIFNIVQWQDYLYFIEGIYPAFIFPLCVYLSSPGNLFKLFRSFMTIGVVMAIINAFYPPTDGMMSMAHNMLWLNIFIFFFSYIKRKYYVMILIAAYLVVSYDFDRRSIYLGYIIPLLILLALPIIKMKIVRWFAFIFAALLPLILLYMFVSGFFNIFEFMGAEYMVTNINENGRHLTVDSRTGVYQDVTEAIFETDKWYVSYIGLGGNGKVRVDNNGHSSTGFENLRNGQETGMLNYIQYGGIWGLIVYGLFLLTASYKALFKSKNDFLLMMGMFILYKYVYSFIEDEVTGNAPTFYHFLWIGMCFNKRFRLMTNTQTKEWAMVLFNFSKKRNDGYNK